MITIFENFQFHVYFDMENHAIRYCVGDKSLSLTCVNIDIHEQVVDEDDVDALALIVSYHDNLDFCFDKADDYDEFKQMLREDVVARATELFDFSFIMKESHESDTAYYERLSESCYFALHLDIVRQVAKFSDDLSDKHVSVYMFDDESLYVIARSIS